MEGKTVTRVDKTGRVYLPQALREAAGIGVNSIVNVEIRDGTVVLRKRVKKVAKNARGIFRLKAHVEDVDYEVRRLSADDARRELSEIRRR